MATASINGAPIVHASHLRTTRPCQTKRRNVHQRRTRRHLKGRQLTKTQYPRRTSTLHINSVRISTTRSKHATSNGIRIAGHRTRHTPHGQKFIGKSTTSHDTSPGEFGTAAADIAVDPNRDAIDKCALVGFASITERYPRLNAPSNAPVPECIEPLSTGATIPTSDSDYAIDANRVFNEV